MAIGCSHSHSPAHTQIDDLASGEFYKHSILYWDYYSKSEPVHTVETSHENSCSWSRTLGLACSKRKTTVTLLMFLNLRTFH